MLPRPHHGSVSTSSSSGPNVTRWEQELQIVLKWNGSDVGPCAKVCCQEAVQVTAAHPAFVCIEKTVAPRWPTCQEQSSGDGVQGPGYSGVSEYWQSPRLTDLQYVQLAAADRSVFDGLPLNTVIATKDHRYGFSGGGCPANWTHTIKHQKQLVVSGNATNRYPEWKVVQR